VVGNSIYRNVPALSNPKRDAQAVATAFRNVGFQTVMAETDLTRDAFLKALRAFEEKADKADWAVIYYAGHGLEMGGTNYLVPIDARLKTDRDVQDETVSMDRMLMATENAKRLRLVVLDACRDNPFVRNMRRTIATRSIGRGLAQVEPEGGTLVAYAAKAGQVAQDGEGENSPFAVAFVRNVLKKQEIGKLFRQVRDEVLTVTRRQQEPFTYGSLPSEDLYFAVK
jgi:uncharacterized caspase-like protein